MNDDFSNIEYRIAFVDENIRNSVAYQIRALRAKRGWSQSQLADRSGTKQNVISRLENPDYGKFTISTLLALAAAFDVALVVKFVSFGKLSESLHDLRPDTLAVPSYAEEQVVAMNKHGRTSGVDTEPSAWASALVNTPPQSAEVPIGRRHERGALSAIAARGQHHPRELRV